MRILSLAYALSIGATALLLTACGASQQPFGAPGAITQNPAAHGSKTFDYTGREQHFKVPTGVTQLAVVARGASGPYGTSSYYCTVIGGLGGVVKATIPVTPGESLAVFVGGEGTIGAPCGSEYGNGSGGFNGGGNGGPASYSANGDGGGGASDVRQRGSALSDRILVAGGGGGQGALDRGGSGAGGAGGGLQSGRGASAAFPTAARGPNLAEAATAERSSAAGAAAKARRITEATRRDIPAIAAP